jgi:hypothetical protein
MPQLHLPLFPIGATEITEVLSFCRTDETVTYFHYGLPIFSHAQDDRASFRFITALLHVTCGAKQAELARTFGIPKINIKRVVKIYRASGPAGFFAERAHRGAAVLTESVMQQAQSQLDAGQTPREVAALLEIKPDTLIKAIRAKRLRTPIKKKTSKAQNSLKKRALSTVPTKVSARNKTAT